MTSQSPRIYIYKITFEEVSYYYYGVHKEKKFNEYYMGSPYTHKWMWDFYTPKKQILQLFDFTDEGWLEAQEVEKRLIRPFYNTDKWCLNEGCGGKISIQISRENGKRVGKINGRIAGQKNKENKTGVCGLTPEERSEIGKKGGETNKKNQTGICGLTPEERSENGKISGKKGGSISGKRNYEKGIGIHAQTKEERSEIGKKGGETNKKNQTGICGLTPEERSENGKKGVETQKKLGLGIFSRTKEQMIENGKKAGQKNKENKTGVCGLTKEQRIENGKKSYELGIGVHGLTKEQRIENGKKSGAKGGNRAYELGVGIHALTPEQRSEIGRKNLSQKWICLETGYISNPCGLSAYQRARGIDTSKNNRRRIS